MHRSEIGLRQSHLLQRSALLRQRLCSDAATLQRSLAVADRAWSSLRWLYLHPGWPLGVLGVWMAVKPRRLLQMARRGWWLYRMTSRWRQWSTALAKFSN